MVTVWFLLVDATEEMGCLSVVPGSHRGGLLTHCGGRTGPLEVPQKLFDRERAIAMPMHRGSALFMHRRTLHSSLPNKSDRVRQSFDLRYQPVGQPTGRSAFPGFVARSRSNPEMELRDADAWTALWTEARRAMSRGDNPAFNRWDATATVCA